MLTMEDVFPPFRLRIRCGAIEQRVLRDDDIPELVDLVRGGVQAPGTPMPFLTDWHEAPFAPGRSPCRGGGSSAPRSPRTRGTSR